MKIHYLCLFVIISIIQYSCTETELIDDLQFQKNLLSGTGSYNDIERTWKIDSITFNGEGLFLSNSQLNYTKTFSSSGKYVDSDGNSGLWEIPNINNLEIQILNTVTEKSLIYMILDINSINLNLELVDQTNIYKYFFIRYDE